MTSSNDCSRSPGRPASIAAAIRVFLTVLTASAAAPDEPVALDGRSLSGESSETQATFRAVWGDRAAAEWVLEHNVELQVAADQTVTPTVTPSAP